MRSLYTRTQLQQTQFTKAKKYGLRVVIGLLISALVVGTGQMTAQPTHALVPLIAKEAATAGAFFYVILKQQQHEKASKKLEAQCMNPVNKNFPLCLPLKDITKPLPLADIQKWIKAQCKKDSACIEKLVQGIEILFKTFTKMPIQLGPTLCTHPNFTLLAETLEQYCKKGGFLPSKLGKPKPGGTSGIGGKTRVSSSANSNSGAVRSGKTPSENKYLGTGSALGKKVKNALYGAENRLKYKIRSHRKPPLSIYEPQLKKLEKAEKDLGIVQGFLGRLKVLQGDTKTLKSMIGNKTSSPSSLDATIQKRLDDLYREYVEKIKVEPKNPIKKELDDKYPGINSKFGKKLTSTIKGKIRSLPNSEEDLKNKLESLLEKIEDLQDPLADAIDRMQHIHENKKTEQENNIRTLHEKIQVALQKKDNEYQVLLEAK